MRILKKTKTKTVFEFMGVYEVEVKKTGEINVYFDYSSRGLLIDDNVTKLVLKSFLANLEDYQKKNLNIA